MASFKETKTLIKINRKEFITSSCAALCALGIGELISCFDISSAQNVDPFIQPARHWRSLPSQMVTCELCPNGCELSPGQRGICRSRINQGGRLFTMVYSRIATIHIDPIEKKPLFHFMPGSNALSLATAGCNLSCRFCQNWQLSQSRPEDLESQRITPENLVRNARSNETPVIAFTYNEPTIQFEYIIDSAARARSAGIKSVIISNGYIQPAAGKEFANALDAIKIDLKAFTQQFYSTICGGNLNAVLANLELIHAARRWLEIVVLVIPSLNDSPTEIRTMARWIKNHLSVDVPLHFLRFHPIYRLTNIPVTPVSTLERCKEIANAEGIRYAYIGNVPGHRFGNTYCHSCGRELISRTGIVTRRNLLKQGRCPFCHTRIPGIWV